MRRGRPGVAGLQARKKDGEKFKDVGEKMEQDQMEHISKQLAIFKENLEVFAKNHKNEINKNPVFRRQFQQMCAQVGVDPLASNKGFWAQMLGMGDFYYELGVQVIDVCLATQAQNGGLLLLSELLVKLSQKRSQQSQAISEDDVCCAIEKVAVLGNGFRVLTMAQRKLVVSVPVEMNRDHLSLIELAEVRGYITVSQAVKHLAWPQQRLDHVLQLLMEQGMVWVDEQMEGGEVAFWLPSLLNKQQWEVAEQKA